MSSPQLIIYTDGSCMPNPGRGGWAFIAIESEEKCEFHISGSCKETTNNIMEMSAVIEALKMFHYISTFKIYSDSQYVINCAQGKWKRNKNLELWEKFDTYSKGKKITWEWVKGHSGNKYNEMVDKMAKNEIS